ncbi:MAG: hypothetical protein FRX49_02872 [Trebouxia sp. A1-2]|nr:MAG: hypothetical protein FRX49_02872 [Trebouxia sp. A1-2]
MVPLLQGMPSTSYAADMLGSQANETVLIEQPQAYVTQKARVKRNRRTEWDYYVQFPGFPEDEGNWYSARAIKTQHPRGAELIREFEHPDDAADVTPPSSAPKSQPTQQAVPFTQDAGPSQIGSLPMHVSGAHEHFQQPHTQDQFASQLQQPAEYRPVNLVAPKPGFHMNQAHGLHPALVDDAFNTASQSDLQPQLHWSFDRLQQAPQYKPAHFIPPSMEAGQVQQSHMQYGAGYHAHTAMPMQAGHAYASTSKMQPAMHAGMLGQASDQSQGPAAQTQQPGLSSAQQTNWGLGLQPQWPARPPHPALGGASAQSQLAAKHMAHQMPTQQLPNQMPLQYQQHPVGQSQQTLKQLHMQPHYALHQQPAQAAAAAGHQNPHSTLRPARAQLDASHQGCEAFRPAVQECIAAAGLPQCKPFYQQALDRAKQERAAQMPAQPSSGVAMQEQHARLKSQEHAMPDASAVAEADTIREGAGEGEEHQRIEPAAFQAASPTLTDDSGLGMDIVDQVEQSKARKYMSASKWPTASIAGARRVGESLELHVKWTDGYDTWISLEALKRRQHCKSAIIDYLVSKVRKKTKG